MDEENIVGRYWCHVCSQVVNPITELIEIKCPRCNNGFVEHVEEDGLHLGGGISASSAETASSTDTNTDNTAADREQPSVRAVSMWAPILLGMLGGNRNTQSSSESPADSGSGGGDDEDALLSLLLRRRQQRSSGPTVHLLSGLQESNGESGSEGERERHHMILINPFNQAVIIQGSFATSRQDDGSNSNSNFAATSAAFGDYFLGPGLEQLLQHLAENDPNRHGTPPAQKAAVEAMPAVEVEEKMTCTVCLEELEIGEWAREMPCKHRFHGDCILPWLKMHSSCPVCRFQMPVEEPKDTGRSSGEEGGVAGAGGRTEGGGNGRRFWLPLPLPWPFNGLFSMPMSSSGGANDNDNSSSPHISLHSIRLLVSSTTVKTTNKAKLFLNFHYQQSLSGEYSAAMIFDRIRSIYKAEIVFTGSIPISEISLVISKDENHLHLFLELWQSSLSEVYVLFQINNSHILTDRCIDLSPSFNKLGSKGLDTIMSNGNSSISLLQIQEELFYMDFQVLNVSYRFSSLLFCQSQLALLFLLAYLSNI